MDTKLFSAELTEDEAGRAATEIMRLQDEQKKKNNKSIAMSIGVCVIFVMGAIFFGKDLAVVIRTSENKFDIIENAFYFLMMPVMIVATIVILVGKLNKRNGYWQDYYVYKGRVEGVRAIDENDSYLAVDFTIPGFEKALTMDVEISKAEFIADGSEIIVIRFPFQCGKLLRNYSGEQGTRFQEYHLVP